ncbi:hypothetical protein [Hyphomonas sp.]|jgi:hypothetical protein|uniref:hypothetical protein n=1 Tax=Hyphomonas sp. TaxID=87 RepID=UPI0025BD7B65|nr:hypothetical protein [Hyphomonas sp.]|tara:strand:- start:238 stop:402 length:165 start_codon:yes stop_codon:yes gene_type:complete
MKKETTNPTVVRGVKELDRLSNLYYKSRDEKYLEEWYQLTKKLAALLPQVSQGG